MLNKGKQLYIDLYMYMGNIDLRTSHKKDSMKRKTMMKFDFILVF